MPVVLTFDVQDDDTNSRGRVQSFFERLGWQNLGGSSYRYPFLGDNEVEDWFNHVIPALMLFRAYLMAGNGTLSKFTLDIQSSTGFDTNSHPVFGHQPVPSAAITLNTTSATKFREQSLRDWIDSIPYPY